MKLILTSLLVLFIFCCDAQITKTEEVKTTFDREIAHVKELFRAEMEAIKMAKELQAKEYERRLEILNGEAIQLKSMQNTYVPRETFEAFQVTILNIMEAQGKQITELQNWKSTIVGQLALAGIGLTIIMFLISKFLPFTKKEPKT